MSTVFISGSIAIKQLDTPVLERINNITAQEHHIIIGDAAGVDACVQRAMQELPYHRLTVYCTGKRARHNLGHWPVQFVPSNLPPGSKAFFTAKDEQMADDCDVGLMIWDSVSRGTLKNIRELLQRNKFSVVYVQPEQSFYTIKSHTDLENMLEHTQHSTGTIYPSQRAHAPTTQAIVPAHAALF